MHIAEISDRRRRHSAQVKLHEPREYDGMRMLRAAGSPLLAEFSPAGGVRDHIYLIDPLGNLMLRFPKNADPREMQKDLVRLLKISRFG